MHPDVFPTTDTGLQVTGIAGNSEFASRPDRPRDAAAEMEAMRRIAHAFVERSDMVLQELVNAAVGLCGADSAGISIVREDGSAEAYYHWLATAGQYSSFLNAILPEYPSACGICLERGRPQHFLVRKPFFDLLGVEAPLVTDGILIPWVAGQVRGTIFIMAHERTQAFNLKDCQLMEVLGNFAATGVRQQQQQAALLEQASAAAAAAMANDLAHKINNPLQSLTNILYLAAEGNNGREVKELGQQALGHLTRLSALVEKLLALPYHKLP